MSIPAKVSTDMRVSAPRGTAVLQPDPGENDDRGSFRLASIFSESVRTGVHAVLWCTAGLASGGCLTAIYFFGGFVPAMCLSALLIMILFTLIGLTRLGEKTDLYLRNRDHYYREFFENAVEGVFRTTPDGHYLSVNRALAKIFGYRSKEELLGKSGRIPEHIYVSPERRRDFQDQIARNGEVSNFVSEIRRRNGSTIWISENARAVYDKYGRIVCYEGTIEDISAQIRAERMMQEALHKAEEANRAKGAFLATMSHELRTPLNAIIGFSEIIKQEMLGPLKPLKYRDYAGDIYNSGIHLLAIINDILDASRLEGGTIALDISAHRIELLIDEAITSARALTSDTRDIILANAPDLPQVMVDGKRIAQCIGKLVTNALKFTPNGGTITVRADMGQDGGMRISVIDTGIGMKPESIAEAMQPFYQIDNSITRRFDGTGLGLPITKALVELHGGNLYIRSALGEGTMVTISLPQTCTHVT